MIIKDIRLTSDKNNTVLSARCKIRKLGWDTVYFSVDSKQKSYVFEDASPFAAALLIPSMKKGEDLIIHGSISKQLYKGMQAVMKEVLDWNIGLKAIEIKADVLTDDAHKPYKTGSFFSGGVDSFYTYLKHKNDKSPADRVDTFIFVNNSFDIDASNQALWDQTLKNISDIAAEENIELIVVKSNVNSHELLAPILAWDYIHGGCLAATGLFLRQAYRKIYIPSTHSVAEQIPWGSNLALDHNWSTGNTEFVHDGSETIRLNKVTTQIARSPLALKHLRVCYRNLNGTYNCGACDKCLRTMVNLYIAGALDKAETFPHELDIDLIARTTTIRGEDGGIFHGENLAALRRARKSKPLQTAIQSSLDLTAPLPITDHGDKFREWLAFQDHNYTHGKLLLVFSKITGWT